MTTKTTPLQAEKSAYKIGAISVNSGKMFPENGFVMTASQLAALIDEVRGQPVQMILSDADQRDLNIGRAIQRAAMELPENATIAIHLELGSGIVTWFSNGSELHDIESGEPFSAQIHAAIDAAIESISPK